MNNPNNHANAGDKQLPEQHSGESDSQKLVQKHMADEHHHITDEELRNVRISTDHIKLDDDSLLKDDTAGKSDKDEDRDPNHPIITPWDVVD